MYIRGAPAQNTTIMCRSRSPRAARGPGRQHGREEKYENNQESKCCWKGKGVYLALTLVIAGAASASFLTINSMMDKLGAAPAPQIQGEEDIPWQEEQHTPVEEKQEDVPVAPTSPSSTWKPQSKASSATSS